MFVYVIGFLAQALFSARILYQWIMSERAREIVSPVAYWVFSISGSYLLFIYGWLRNDFSIILGQLISYYIYLWNLSEKGHWANIPLLFRIILAGTPFVAVFFALNDIDAFIFSFFQNEEIPLMLVVYGATGQIIFTLRFVYQLIYSYKRHASILPVGFWVISLIGSFIIISYGLFRRDPVLILGQSVGFIAYIRNIIIGRNKQRHEIQ